MDTFIQLPIADEVVQSAIDQQGRVLILSTNRPGLGPQDVIVSRLSSNGTVDTSFGNGGNVFIPIDDLTSATGSTLPLEVAITSNNQVVIGALRFAVADSSVGVTRLNENGSIDRSFGDDGVFQTAVVSLTNFDGSTDPVQIRLDSLDRIIVSSEVFPNPILVRATADGQLDTSFATNGQLTLVPDPSIADEGVQVEPLFGLFNLSADGLGIDSNDNILVFSSAGTAAFGPTEFVIFQRVLSSGQLDTSFGTGGSLVVENTEGAPGGISNLIFDSNNSLVVGGVGSSIDPNGGIARFLLS